MPLSWNEIKERALNFSKKWADASNEEADAKSFLDDFFHVLGISRKRVGTFEHRIKKLDDTDGYIDMLWKGTILIEMKSRGKNLEKAYQQAVEYTHGLKQHELPKYILVSDFENFRLYDLEDDTLTEFKLNDLVNNVHHFGYLLGYQKRVYKEEDPANIKAAELMGKLHDRLKEIGYTGHPLEVYLVRLLFCLFAEDTTIFEKQQFQEYIEQRTNIDGSDLAAKLQELFQVLNTPKGERFKNLDEQLADFPHVNGKLFEEILPMASFDSKMRQALLDCTYIDWSKISPAIFGSMFQSVMNPEERRNLGAHYTSETNILKLIKPLFLDDLWKEFESIKHNKNRLIEFHRRISSYKFLDPACGCGNFLIITYRELRLLELEILRTLNKSGQRVIDISSIILIDVDQFYGIEYEEFPARIAEVAMWLIDHQMNMLVSQEFGQYFVRLPLMKSAHIRVGNALQMDWSALTQSGVYDITADNTNIYMVSEPAAHYGTVNVYSKNVHVVEGAYPKSFSGKTHFDYILGNPPFVGKNEQNQEQKLDMQRVFSSVKGFGILDYVTAWYVKAAQLIANTPTKVAFVSTNSITQGEQVGVLWNLLFNHYNIKIHFAHRTFKWSNEAKGNAAVYCVIIGFANYDTSNKSIFEYEDIRGEAHEVKAKNINPYLVDAKDIIIERSSNAICNVPKIKFGNQPIDGGFLLLNQEEKNEAINAEPYIEKYIRKYVGSHEFINNIPRFCLWLKDAEPVHLRNSSFIIERLKKVKEFRESSSRKETRELASNPSQFAFVSHNETEYVIIPSVSSERRKYIPIGFMPANVIASNLCLIIPNAKLFHFGVLTSEMHMAWVKNICGRLKSDYRYSNSVVYNNFPYLKPSRQASNCNRSRSPKVLDTRLQYPNSSLADLRPLTMPPH